MNLFSVLQHAANEFGKTPAIRFQCSGVTSELSYADLHRLACIFSSMLAEAGVMRGDRVAVFLPNIPEYAVVTYGALRIGAVPVLLSSSLKEEKVREYVENSQAKVLITSDDLAGQAKLASGSPDIAAGVHGGDRCRREHQ